jgi:hypothetical protein
MGSGADADGWCDLGELEDAAKVRKRSGGAQFLSSLSPSFALHLSISRRRG